MAPISDYAQVLGYVSAIAGILTALIAATAAFFVATSLREKSKSGYDIVNQRAELSEMRKAYEEQIKNLSLQLTATEQRWKDVNHLLLSSQRVELKGSSRTQTSNFLTAMGIGEKELTVDPKLVLMLTPFDRSFDQTYQSVVETCRRVGLTCVRGDEEDAHGDILTHILKIMVKARLVVANIGSRNPNVYYELGIAHAMDKPTILISETLNEIPFDIQSKRILIYNDPSELETKLPETLARALSAPLESTAIEKPKAAASALAFPSANFKAVDGLGLMRGVSEYLCVDNEGREIFLPQGPYMFLRLRPENPRLPLGDLETYRIAQSDLRPLQGRRSSHWSIGRHSSGSVAYFPDPQMTNRAIDAAELMFDGELWANDFYFLDASRERFKEHGFAFIPTGAVEEVLVSGLENFLSIATTSVGLDFPFLLEAGFVGVQNYKLAVPPQYFSFSKFEGRILRPNVIYRASIDARPESTFSVLRPLFESLYDSAGIKRPNVPTAGSF